MTFEGSLKVIENDTIQQIAYEFIFSCNYGHILFGFGDKVIY